MSDIHTNDRDMKAGGVSTAAVPYGVAVSQTEGAPAPRGLHRKLLETASQFPFQMGNLTAMAATTGIITMVAGVNFLRGAQTPLDPAAVLAGILIFAAGTYALLATQTVASFKSADETRKRNRDIDDKLASIEAAIERQAALTTREMMLVQDLHEDFAGIVSKNRPQAICQPNTAKCWANLAFDSHYYSVAGKLWGDIWMEVAAGGHNRLVADTGRFIEAWLPRFRVGSGVRQANYVLFARRADMAPGRVPESVRYHLFAFRVLKQLAHSQGESLDLDRIRVAVRLGDPPASCFFVGEYQHRNERMPFTASYTNNADVFKVPRGIWDDSVSINYAPDMVAAHLQNAKAMMASSPIYSLDELEARFGHMVEHPDLGLPPSPPTTTTWVHSSDHFG